MRIILSFFLVAGLMAQEKKKNHDHDHHHDHNHKHSKTQGAHEHGVARIDLAVEGKKIEIEFHVPAMGITGFEHVATSAADKKKQQDALAKLRSNIGTIIAFDSAAGCKIAIKELEVDQHEPDHADVEGHFEANCSRKPAGTRVSFGLTRFFPAIETVKVQAVGTEGSTGAEVKNNTGTITLPK